jgi:hypothetical protein
MNHPRIKHPLILIKNVPNGNNAAYRPHNRLIPYRAIAPRKPNNPMDKQINSSFFFTPYSLPRSTQTKKPRWIISAEVTTALPATSFARSHQFRKKRNGSGELHHPLNSNDPKHSSPQAPASRVIDFLGD